LEQTNMTDNQPPSFYYRWLGPALGNDLDALTADIDALDAGPPLSGQQNSRLFADYFPAPYYIGRELDNLSDRIDAMDGGGEMPGELASSVFAKHNLPAPVSRMLDWMADRVAALKLLPH
jgi:hypothetical protein